ncbi:MAG TPA: DUF309 domain-containing protein [Candidatus Saccharimonadales bacterium]|nr:DUF309 domain-containing protein [Candidatus Saccharimonadales bacterium]
MRNPLPPGARRGLLEEGCRLLSTGEYFAAHEAFEDLWHSTDVQAERDVWQGMAQVAAALVKHDRGESASAITLLAKAARRLEGTPLLLPHAVIVKEWLDALSDPVTREKDLDGANPTPALRRTLAALLGGGATGEDAGGGDLS